MRVVIASERAPKVNGVQRAFRIVGKIYPAGEVTFESVSVESGVAATPLSIEQLIDGARQRAESAYREAARSSTVVEDLYAVGVEGGICVVRDHAFLQSWACVYDGTRYGFGSSGSVEIPAALSVAVVRDGADLGEVIDVFAERHNVRSNEGTWGILTSDMVTREDSFELATLNALAPFFNRALYERVLPGSG